MGEDLVQENRYNDVDLEEYFCDNETKGESENMIHAYKVFDEMPEQNRDDIKVQFCDKSDSGNIPSEILEHKIAIQEVTEYKNDTTIVVNNDMNVVMDDSKWIVINSFAWKPGWNNSKKEEPGGISFDDWLNMETNGVEHEVKDLKEDVCLENGSVVNMNMARESNNVDQDAQGSVGTKRWIGDINDIDEDDISSLNVMPNKLDDKVDANKEDGHESGTSFVVGMLVESILSNTSGETGKNELGVLEISKNNWIAKDLFYVQSFLNSSCDDTEMGVSGISESLKSSNDEVDWLGNNLSSEFEKLSYDTMKDVRVSSFMNGVNRNRDEFFQSDRAGGEAVNKECELEKLDQAYMTEVLVIVVLIDDVVVTSKIVNESEIVKGVEDFVVKSIRLLSKDDRVKRVFVLSDIEFEQASNDSWETDYEALKRKFESRGYGKVPEIVFWNIRNSNPTPVTANQKGVALLCGFLKSFLTLFVERGEAQEELLMLCISFIRRKWICLLHYSVKVSSFFFVRNGGIDIVSLSDLGYFGCGWWSLSCSEAFYVLDRMLEQEIRHNEYTFTAPAHASTALRDIKLGMQFVGNSSISFYSKCGSMEDSLLAFNSLQDLPFDPGIGFWKALLGGCHMDRELVVINTKKRWLSCVVSIVVGPLEWNGSVKIMRKICAKIADIQLGIQLHQQVTKVIVPDVSLHNFLVTRVEHYVTFVDIMGRHRQPEEVMNVIKGINTTQDKAVWGALLSAGIVHNNRKLVRVAVLKFLKKYLMEFVETSSRALLGILFGILPTEMGHQASLSLDSYERPMFKVHSKSVNRELVQSSLVDVEMEVVRMNVNNHEISDVYKIMSPLIMDEEIMGKVLEYDSNKASGRVVISRATVGLVWTTLDEEVQLVEARINLKDLAEISSDVIGSLEILVELCKGDSDFIRSAAVIITNVAYLMILMVIGCIGNQRNKPNTGSKPAEAEESCFFRDDVELAKSRGDVINEANFLEKTGHFREELYGTTKSLAIGSASMKRLVADPNGIHSKSDDIVCSITKDGFRLIQLYVPEKNMKGNVRKFIRSCHQIGHNTPSEIVTSKLMMKSKFRLCERYDGEYLQKMYSAFYIERAAPENELDGFNLHSPGLPNNRGIHK